MQATARSQRAVASLLKERLLVRPGHGSGGVLRPAGAFGDLCGLWLADLEARDLNEGTKQNYRPWPTIATLKKQTFTWIEEYYNRARRHSTLGYLTPAEYEYELGFRHIHELAA